MMNKYIYSYSLNVGNNNKQIINISNNRNIIVPALDMIHKLTIPSRSIIKSKFNIYNLSLNFKRNRFFFCFDMNTSKKIIFNNSLGIISKRFSDKKSYLKSNERLYIL